MKIFWAFLSGFFIFGHDDNSNSHRDQFLVTMTIGIVIATKF